jgi:hypothetical protein
MKAMTCIRGFEFRRFWRRTCRHQEIGKRVSTRVLKPWGFAETLTLMSSNKDEHL